MVQRMARGEVHSPGVVHYGALQRLRELDQTSHACWRAGEAIADDHWTLRGDQHLCCVGKRACISYRRHDPGELRYAQSLRIGDGIFLQLRVEREQHRAHRRRRRDLVGAHRRLGEMLERSGLVVPLDKVAYDCGRVDRRMHPLDPGRPLVPLDDIADHYVDRNPIAPGIIESHARVLQPDRAVAHHGHGLAFDLCVALRHVDGDLLVRAGEDFRLGVLAVVDEGLRGSRGMPTRSSWRDSRYPVS